MLTISGSMFAFSVIIVMIVHLLCVYAGHEVPVM